MWKKVKKSILPQNRLFYASVVFVAFVAFLLLKCCLSKSSYSDLHFGYPSFFHISYSLGVILDWKFIFEKNPLLLTFVRNFHMENAEFGDFEHMAIQNLKDLTKGCPGQFWTWKSLFLTIFFILVRQNPEKINFGEFRKNRFLVILQQFCLCETAHLGWFWCKKCKNSKVNLAIILVIIMLYFGKFWKFKWFLAPKSAVVPQKATHVAFPAPPFVI